MHRLLALFITSLALAGVVSAATPADPGAPPDAVRHWQSLRFGMFIHWGPVSLTGHEIGWSRGNQTPVEEYDGLYKQFDPSRFDADEWVQAAKDAGIKYMVLTTKHHDGFCLWDSAATEYDIMATPFGRDVVKELSEACRKGGIEFGTYYSVCDWYNPAFPLGSPGGKTKNPNPDLQAYDVYLQQQVNELVTKYGPLLTMWFDVPQVYGAEYGVDMIRTLRELQPDIVINSRAHAGDRKRVGDYSTPEQRVGGFNRTRPWETCMTLCRQWAWKPDDKMKSLQKCLRTMLAVVGSDGNFLYNVGPMPDGRIEERQVERLREMGAWLARYGDGIYDTRGGPFRPGAWGVSTCRDNRIYLFVWQVPEDGRLWLPALPLRITGARALSGGDVAFDQNEERVSVTPPPLPEDGIATVVELTVDGEAFTLPVSEASVLGLPVPVVGASASNVYREQDTYRASRAIDGNPETRWATDAGTHTAWLELDLGEPRAVTGALISEAHPGRVTDFALEGFDGEAWRTLYEGKTIGAYGAFTFERAYVSKLRLNIRAATEGPTLFEFTAIRRIGAGAARGDPAALLQPASSGVLVPQQVLAEPAVHVQ